MQEIAGKCSVTFSYTGEFRCTSLTDMSSTALCPFIQLIPRITSIPSPLNTMRSVSNTHPNKSSGTFQIIRSASTRPPGVLITYGAPDAISVNLAFLAHVELIKSCDAPESNNMTVGRTFKKNVPASTSSPMGPYASSPQ
jgi:hypothetical protein